MSHDDGMIPNKQSKPEVAEKDIRGKGMACISMAAGPPSGTFDWLLSLRSHPQLREWLLPSAHGLGAEARVLVVGCGDSTLSEDLWESGFTNVVGVDLEERCIDASRARTAGKAGLAWRALDLTSEVGLPAELGRFDLALDKGTLDAIVCAGDDAACRACWNVRRALAPGGVLVVVTLHRDGKVQRFLEAPALGFASVHAHELSVPPVFDGKVVVCTLSAPSGLGEGGASAEVASERALAEGYARYRAHVLAAPYEDATPLLTAQREAEIRMHFKLRAHAISERPGAAETAGLPLREVYELIFSAAERGEYDLRDFEEDVAAFERRLVCEVWAADDAVRFLREMQ